MNWLDVLRSNLVGPDSQWFWSMVEAFILAVTLTLIYRQVAAQRHSNMLQTLRDFEQRWFSPEMVKSRKYICT